MYRSLCLVLFGLLLADAGYAKSAGSVPKYLSYSLASSSYGPLKIGMTVEQASAALGVKLLSGEDSSKPGFSQVDHDACHFVTPEAKDIGLAFMVQNGVITRIDVSKGNIKTLSGLRIGSTAIDVKKRYSKSLRIEPHKFGTADDQYLIARVTSKNEIVFEVIEGKVVTFRGGLAAAIAQVEGCL